MKRLYITFENYIIFRKNEHGHGSYTLLYQLLSKWEEKERSNGKSPIGKLSI